MLNELIKKLIRLANSNSNEHEANLAARKACKLISEDKTLMSDDKGRRSQQQATVQTNYNPFTANYVDEEWLGFSNRRTKKEKEEQHKTNYSGQPTPEDYAQKKAKPWDPGDMRNYSKTVPPRNLKCKTCGNVVATGFVGPPQVFECADCWGKDIPI